MKDLKPTEKSPAIEEFITRFTGIDRRTAITTRVCPTCGGEVLGFRDELSEKEYCISGLCQKCQDCVFGVNDE